MSVITRLFAYLAPGRSTPAAPPAPPVPGVPVLAVGEAPQAPSLPAAGPRFMFCMGFVMREEGGYSNHPADNGGPTNFGITHRTLADWRGVRSVTAEQVRAMSHEEARAILRARYWNAVRGDDMPPGVDLALFDWSVNAGPARAVRGLQRLVGVSADGAIGPMTLAALRGREPMNLAYALCDTRLAHLRGLDDWRVFGKGWTARVERVRAASRGILHKSAGDAPALVPKHHCLVAVPHAPTLPQGARLAHHHRL
ncbi:MAG: hypothetical protein K2X46_06745 [Roseomonas sp.]|nr:hypothetical protein [Roseomonas sp.]